jgi:hypothetical protein
MKIAYSTTLDDIVAFNRYHYAHSPTIRQMKVLWICSTNFLLLALGEACIIFFDASFDWVPVLLVPIGLMVLFQWWYYPRALARNARKLLGEGKNKGLIGPRELELTDTGLMSRNDIGMSFVVFAAIEKIGVDSKHLFIYINALTAHVVPADAVTEGDYQQFMEALEKRLTQDSDREIST